MKFFKRRNNVSHSRYSQPVDEGRLIRRQIAGCRVCSGDMLQQLANATEDVSASIDDFNSYAAHSLKSVLNKIGAITVTLSKCLQTTFQQEVLTMSRSAYEAARDVVMSLQLDVAHFKTAMQERCERKAGTGNSSSFKRDLAVLGVALIWVCGSGLWVVR